MDVQAENGIEDLRWKFRRRDSNDEHYVLAPAGRASLKGRMGSYV